MVGYCEHTKGYRLADSQQPRRVIKARDVIFLEDSMKENKISDETVKYNTNVNIFSKTHYIQDINESAKEEEENKSTSTCSNYQSMDDSESIVEEGNEDDDTLAKDNIQEANRPVRNRRQPEWTKDYVMSTISLDGDVIIDEPHSYTEAISCSYKNEWTNAMKNEYKSLIDNNVWKLVERPKNVNVVKSKWVYKLKRDASGNIDRFKARLVACGYSQVQGVDFDETFSPVVRYSTLRLLLAIGNERDMDIDHLDISTAFLNSNLNEKKYIYGTTTRFYI